MSSREIAELVEKRHDNVKRTIETLVEAGVIACPQIEDVQEIGGNNRTYTTQQYRVGKRDSYVIVAQLSLNSWTVTARTVFHMRCPKISNRKNKLPAFPFPNVA